jgi:hypothetical protein
MPQPHKKKIWGCNHHIPENISREITRWKKACSTEMDPNYAPETYISLSKVGKMGSIRVYHRGILSQELYIDHIIKSQQIYQIKPFYSKDALFLKINEWLIGDNNTDIMMRHKNGGEDPINVYIMRY